jgi:hypothetical protein
VKRLDLPDVTRVQDGRSSLVEPPLNPEWDEPTKLAWHAAVIAHDTGLRITLHDEAWTDGQGHPRSGYYGITVYGANGGPVSSAAAFTYRDAWTYLNGIGVGVRATRETR